METIADFNALMNKLQSMTNRKRVAVVCPNDSHTEYVIERGLNEGLVNFLLIKGGACSPELRNICAQFSDHVEVIDTPTPDDAARIAVQAVREGKADVLMKGTINTDNLLKAVLNKECGLLQEGHILTHITMAQIPSYHKLLLFSDAAVIPNPTLEQFRAIVKYGAHICHHIGIARPNIALIHCTEKTSEKFPHTLSYQQLKEDAANGMFGDVESGRLKGIQSPVVGNADMLVFPNIEAGNVFYKTISLFADAEMAGILCGTTAPVMVASRADSNQSKYNSLALACIAGNDK